MAQSVSATGTPTPQLVALRVTVTEHVRAVADPMRNEHKTPKFATRITISLENASCRSNVLHEKRAVRAERRTAGTRFAPVFPRT